MNRAGELRIYIYIYIETRIKYLHVHILGTHIYIVYYSNIKIVAMVIRDRYDPVQVLYRNMLNVYAFFLF